MPIAGGLEATARVDVLPVEGRDSSGKEGGVQADKVGSLTQRTAEALRLRIVDGPLRSGEKLPTEKALAIELGVSRTVVREAVAGLRADGLVEARHGVGVFVASKGGGVMDAPATSADPFAVASVLDVLELRMAVEVHAAGLAAVRRSWSQEERIWSSAERMRQAAESGEPTEHLDLAFHRSVAEAANNPAFVAFFEQLGRHAIPSNALASRVESSRVAERYLTRCQSEHFVIYQAIADSDVEAARAAMKAHLAVSQERFRGLDEHDAGSLFDEKYDVT